MITLKSFQILKSLRKNSIEYQFINLSKDQLNILLPQKIGRDTLFFFKFCSPLQFVSFNIHNFFSSFFFFICCRKIFNRVTRTLLILYSLSLSLSKQTLSKRLRCSNDNIVQEKRPSVHRICNNRICVCVYVFLSTKMRNQCNNVEKIPENTGFCYTKFL